MKKKKKNEGPVEPQVKSGVGVIVCKGHKVLVGKRRGSHGAGAWAFPGGHIEPTDKTLKACGEREVREETGITCNVFSPDKYRQDLFTTYEILSKDGKKIYVTPYLVADYLIGGEEYQDGPDTKVLPLEPDKHECWYWKSLEELAQLVSTDENKIWIPVNQVVYYLSQMWQAPK